MHIVRMTSDGAIHWKEILEITSLEAFAREREAEMNKSGTKHRHYSVVSQSQVDCWDEHGKLLESFLVCKKKPARMPPTPN